jgi:hypothetical protein
MTVDDKFRSRKFGITTTTLLISSVALFSNQLTGGEWVAVVTIILGLYSAANITEKKII